MSGNQSCVRCSGGPAKFCACQEPCGFPGCAAGSASPCCPNREHHVAHEAAQRRSLAALGHLVDEAEILRRKLKAGRVPDGSETQRLANAVRDLTEYLSRLETLRDVREWHAADEAEKASTTAESSNPLARAHRTETGALCACRDRERHGEPFSEVGGT